MSCNDCLQNCNEITSDQCVQYTGPAIPLLGICTGDSLSQTENNIVNALLSALNGTGILPSQVTLANCVWLQTQFGLQSPTLNNLLQLLINGECTLYTLITDLQAQVAAGQSGTVFDTACLTGLPATPDIDDIIQAVITLLCNLNATVAAFPSTYVQNSDLTNLVTTIVNNITTGGNTNAVPQQNTKMVPGVAYEYYGSLSNFDNTGKGITALGWDSVYICNGNAGTPDKRGRVAVGAIRNIPGGSLDAPVDPTNPLNPNWGQGDKAGENTHLLTVPEIPNHSHTITDPGHAHVQRVFKANGQTISVGGNIPPGYGEASPDVSGAFMTQPANTGITINGVGGSQPHNNIQPSIGAVYIMYIQ